jgi:hypothetical protein
MATNMNQAQSSKSEPTQPTHAVASVATAPVVITRRRIDAVLVGLGVIILLVLGTSAALLTWGSTFSGNYVRDELASQHIRFGSAKSLEDEGRADLTKYADQKLDSGVKAQAYASYINGHLTKIGKGLTYAELATPERQAKLDVKTAVDTSQPQAKVDELQTTADGITETRNTLFKGETLRGLLLTAYAWSMVGRIAGFAAIGAIIAAGLTAILVIFGVNHLVTNRSPSLALTRLPPA